MTCRAAAQDSEKTSQSTVISRRWNYCDSVATSAQKMEAVPWKQYKLSVLREHKASLVFSLGNGFQVRNLLVSCRPSRYSKPTRFLTSACRPKNGKLRNPTSRSGHSDILVVHLQHSSIWKVPDKFFDRATQQRLHERSLTAFRLDWLSEDMVETSHKRRHSSRW